MQSPLHRFPVPAWVALCLPPFFPLLRPDALRRQATGTTCKVTSGSRSPKETRDERAQCSTLYGGTPGVQSSVWAKRRDGGRQVAVATETASRENGADGHVRT